LGHREDVRPIFEIYPRAGRWWLDMPGSNPVVFVCPEDAIGYGRCRAYGGGAEIWVLDKWGAVERVILAVASAENRPTFGGGLH
jgi:hypothetical protein